MVTPDFSSFTTAQKSALLAAIQAEILRRASGGAVQSGSSSAQSFSVQKMSDDTLTSYLNALTAEMGFEQPEIRVRPNFSGAPSL